MEYYFDVQGFIGYNNEFIPKELALIHQGQHQHFLIKSPFEFNKLSTALQRQVKWLNHHHHGISWEDGTTNLTFVKNLIKMEFVRIIHNLHRTFKKR